MYMMIPPGPRRVVKVGPYDIQLENPASVEVVIQDGAFIFQSEAQYKIFNKGKKSIMLGYPDPQSSQINNQEAPRRRSIEENIEDTFALAKETLKATDDVKSTVMEIRDNLSGNFGGAALRLLHEEAARQGVNALRMEHEHIIHKAIKAAKNLLAKKALEDVLKKIINSEVPKVALLDKITRESL